MAKVNMYQKVHSMRLVIEQRAGFIFGQDNLQKLIFGMLVHVPKTKTYIDKQI